MISEALGMKPLMGERKQKFLSTLIVSFGAFFGFEVLNYILALYQIDAYILVSFYVYFFHVFWLTFIFDLHFKKKGVLAYGHLNQAGFKLLKSALRDRVAHVFNWSYLRHFQNYLVLPGLLYWSIVILLFLNPFKEPLKQGLIVIGSFCMTVAYWYMKEMFSRNMEAHEWGIKVLALVKVLAAFFIYSATFGLAFYYGFGLDFLLPAIFCVTFLLIYQALFQHKLLNFNLHFLILGISGACALVSYWVYQNWNWNYLAGALFVLAVYNTLWGFLHHHLERTLTKKLVFEYTLMLLVVLSLLLAGNNFDSRIL